MTAALATSPTPPLLVIAHCPLNPDVTPALKHYQFGRTQWFVSCEGESNGDWDICGPCRATPDQAIAEWNRAWVKS